MCGQTFTVKWAALEAFSFFRKTRIVYQKTSIYLHHQMCTQCFSNSDHLFDTWDSNGPALLNISQTELLA